MKRLFLLVSLLVSCASLAAESENSEILRRLRPSEREQGGELQSTLGIAPQVFFNLGPAFSWFGRLQIPARIFFGFEMDAFRDTRPTQLILGEIGYAFLGKKGGPWISVSGGATYTWSPPLERPIGLQYIIKAALGWDLMLGETISLGLSVAADYLHMVQVMQNIYGPDSKGPGLPLTLSIPLRVWF